MQVRKFEAGSMQEALKLVKAELGPEAIILSARDNSSGYGLLHQASVEITAAIPERSLHKKKYFESRLKEADQIRFREAPARLQKNLIERSVNRYVEQAEKAQIKSRPRYATIQDDDSTVADVAAPNTAPVSQSAHERIRTAVQAAWTAGKDIVPEPTPKKDAAPQVFKDSSAAGGEIASLKQEISRLRTMLSELAKAKETTVATSHPLAMYGLPYEMVPAQEKLRSTGLDPDIVIEILKEAKSKLGVEKCLKRPLVEAFAAQWILDNTKITSEPFAGRVHLFVGPSGSGKTSTLVKFASYLVLREKKSVAVLTGDVQKVGAAEQLKIFCKILNVPFAVLRNRQDWSYLLDQLKGVDHILVDTAGTSLRQMEDIDQSRSQLPPEGEVFSTHLVLPATMRDRDGYDLAQRFKILKVKDLIISHIDQSSQHGIIFNLQRKTGLPLNSFGLGPQIPEDFEIATKERVLDLMYKLSQLKTGRQVHE